MVKIVKAKEVYHESYMKEYNIDPETEIEISELYSEPNTEQEEALIAFNEVWDAYQCELCELEEEKDLE